MIALDTNVLVRFLVDDDTTQAARARSLIERSTEDGERCLVPAIVICELVWVLTSCYDLSRSQVGEVLRNLQRARQLALQAPDEVARALASFAVGKEDLADYLIRELARTEGCEAVATFDRAVQGEAGFIEP